MTTKAVSRGSAKRIAVLGGGPKGIALAVKAHVLREMGFPAPEVVVIDKYDCAANWSGHYGYTDGLQILGTPPDKDIGFPYMSSCWSLNGKDSNRDVNRRMQDYSWQSYLIAEKRYSEWIDRGRPQPNHQRFTEYLCWAAKEARIEVQKKTVRGIKMKNNSKWVLSCQEYEGSASRDETADGLMITGPGPAIHDIVGYPGDHPRVMDGRTFWKNVSRFASQRSEVAVAVIGTGETAASIAVTLLTILTPTSSVDVISPHGVHYTRGESFAENRLFSEPDPEWASLKEEDRVEFMKRTDRGVFSVNAKKILDSFDHQLHSIPGKATWMGATNTNVRLKIEYPENSPEPESYDYVVVAIGFQPCWFVQLLAKSVKDAIATLAGGLERWHMERTIGKDLAIDRLTPKLHLPMLAGFKQGPGFPNLSCLGLLSDRVLQSYM
jgi:mycobactin lysine-N-oxygenase